MLDKVLAALSLAGLYLFCYIMITFVHEPDLWVVIILVVLIATFFIVRELRMGGSHFESNGNGDSES
jgi:hypothetical protein